MSITLVNFKVPVSLLERFDALCQLTNKTRTSVLIDLMTEYTLTQAKTLEIRNLQFARIDRILGNFRDLNDEPTSAVDTPDHDWIGVQNRSEFDLYEDDDEISARMYEDLMRWDS